MTKSIRFFSLLTYVTNMTQAILELTQCERDSFPDEFVHRDYYCLSVLIDLPQGHIRLRQVTSTDSTRS